MSALDSIKQGLEEANAFSKGERDGSVVHEISLPEINVSESIESLVCEHAIRR